MKSMNDMLEPGIERALGALCPGGYSRKHPVPHKGIA
ncbi:hypothetical protein IWQ51_002378 [Labrenzia sp. EL_142]|nr:hypothetical protein [Labrenzia sp. EL_142]